MARGAYPQPPTNIMTVISRLAAACFIIALPVFLITTNVRILASEVRFYERGFREYGAAEVTGLPLSELDRAAREIIEYFENDATTLRIIVNEGGQEVSLFTPRETHHMEDVKGLIRVVYRAQEISLAFILTYVVAAFLWTRERSLRSLARLSLLGVGAGFAIVAVLGALALSGFEEFWRQFHEIAFSNDLWQLNPATDRLIQMFPEPFWEEATYIVAIMTLAEVALIVGVASAYLFATRQRRQPARRAAVPDSVVAGVVSNEGQN
jgi:integral membrane protein (TIGR01906 family)